MVKRLRYKLPFLNIGCIQKSVCLLLVLGISLSCEDVIAVDLSTSEPRLVIDALIGVDKNNAVPIASGQLRLTLTAPFFQDQVPPAEGATVEIIEEQTGQVFPLTEDEPGIFRTGFPILVADRDYTLVVHYNNEVYTATERLNRTAFIDTLEQKDGALFDQDNETEIEITFTDIPGERNQYLFSFGFGKYLVIDDEFFQDETIPFSYFYEDVAPGDLLTIILFGIDNDFATYADQIFAQSGVNESGPFTVPPTTVRGNISNTTHPSNFAFGYFVLSEFDTQQITLE